jgi:hypothetical protein
MIMVYRLMEAHMAITRPITAEITAGIKSQRLRVKAVIEATVMAICSKVIAIES